jgi:predicted kinase
MLDRREKEGRVRRCHGDLHLRNICLLDGEPCLFDCIEFNDRIATVDVLYDLAFLLMDLWHRSLSDLANLVMNRYLDEADEESGLGVIPFFMAVRAAVRAHVTATQSESGGGNGDLAAEARRYFALAADLLVERPARLIAIGGFSGAGKSTIAAALAAHVGAPPGARIIESDRIRKALFGVVAETRLPSEAYRPEVSERVYGEMGRRAGEVLGAGASVVANAVFDRRPDRQRIEREAGDRHVSFHGIWLEAPPGLLRDRVGARVGGASDANVDVLAAQLARGADSVDWRKVDAARSPARIAADVLAG